MKVAVIYGGISTEREVSINTGREIANNLDRSKYEVVEFLLNKKEDIFNIIGKGIEFAYIALHGEFGEDGTIQSVLEILNIAYSGPGIMTSSLCIDKDITKSIVRDSGVRVIDGINVKKGEKIQFSNLNLGNKVILKPNKGGSSIGIYFASNQEELDFGLNEIFKIDDEVVIERVITGIEISVPIIDGKVYPTVLIEPLKDTFFDYKSKYENGGAKEYVYTFEEKIQNEINDFTIRAYNAIKCKGFARIDYLIMDDIVYFLEVNTLPGMTKNSLLPKSTESLGYSYSETLDLLIGASLKK